MATEETDLDVAINLFRLQAHELIENSKIGTASSAKEAKDTQLYSGLTRVEQYVRDLKGAFDSLPKRTVTAKPNAIFAGYQIHGSEDLPVSIAPPTNMNLGGSYLQGITTRPNTNVDVVIELPSNMFEAKDNIDYRYFDKRAVYIAALASHLRTYSDIRFSDITITNFHGDNLRPIILLHPVQSELKDNQLQRAKGILGKFVIRIIPHVTSSHFHPRKLHPARNCVKNIELQQEKKVYKLANEAPTPNYNQSILEDYFMLQHTFYLAEALTEFPALTELIVLLKVWAAQRGFTGLNVGTTLRDDGVVQAIRAPINIHENSKKDKSQFPGQVNYEYTAPETTFNGFVLTMLVVFLYRMDKLKITQSLYIMFQQTMAFFASTDLLTAPVFLPSSKMGINPHSSIKISPSDVPEHAVMAASFDVVIVDPSGFVNIASRISLSAYHEFRHQALVSLSYIEGFTKFPSLATCRSLTPAHYHSLINAGGSYCSIDNAFEALFLKTVSYDAQFDSYITVELPQKVQSYFPLITDNQTSSVFAPLFQAPAKVENVIIQKSDLIYPKYPTLDPYVGMIYRAYNLLARGLTDRVYLTSVRPSFSTPKRDITFGSTKDSISPVGKILRIGLLNRSDNASRSSDRGPAADDVVLSKEFREFWGNKSDLRRFADGTILETVVWNVPTHQRYSLPDVITKYVLERHLVKNHPNLNISVSGYPFDEVMLYRNVPSTVLFSIDKAYKNRKASKDVVQDKGLDLDLITRKVRAALSTLTHNLQEIDELPLRIVSVDATHASIRETSAFPPIPFSATDAKGIDNNPDSPLCGMSRSAFEPIGVVITLEDSDRWPNQLLAISRAKTAFIIKISSILHERYGLSTTVTSNYIDVFVDGFAFRIQIKLENEMSLFRRATSTQANTTFVIGDSTYRELELETLRRPRHAAFIKNLIIQFPMIAPVARLLHRWVSSHLFSRVLTLEACELLASYVFVCPRPYTAPGSIISAFSRVLDLLSTFNWEKQPLIVPSVVCSRIDPTEGIQTLHFETDITAKDINTIYGTFKLNREKGTGPVMFIATALDLESRHWTLRSGIHEDIDRGQRNEFKLVASPSKANTTLISQFAQISLFSLQQFVREHETKISSWLSLFKTPLELYDAFITLDFSILPENRSRQTLFPLVPNTVDLDEIHAILDPSTTISTSGYKLPPEFEKQEKLEAKAAQKKVATIQGPLHAGFDVIEYYLQDLRKIFGVYATFSLDTLGGRVIAVKFHPDTLTPQKLSQLNAHGTVPVETIEEDEKEDDVATNVVTHVARDKTLLLLECEKLGQGIVDAVYPSYKSLVEHVRY